MIDFPDTRDAWVDQYECEWEFPETFWVIPHGSSLDYCAVTIDSYSNCGKRVRVSGHRHHGWTPDRAFIKTAVPVDKLTSTPSWHEDFKDLYDCPYDPRLRHECPIYKEKTDV